MVGLGQGGVKLSRPLPSSQHLSLTATPGGKKAQCPCFQPTSFSFLTLFLCLKASMG